MKTQLNPLAAALAMGLLWGVSLFVWTLLSLRTGVGAQCLELMTDIYPWYQITTVGAFWGLLWGFLDGFIGTYVVVALYNFFTKKLGK